MFSVRRSFPGFLKQGSLTLLDSSVAGVSIGCGVVIRVSHSSLSEPIVKQLNPIKMKELKIGGTAMTQSPGVNDDRDLETRGKEKTTVFFDITVPRGVKNSCF